MMLGSAAAMTGAVQRDATAGGSQPVDTPGRRVLHFPMDRSVGRVRLWSMPPDGNVPVHLRRADLSDALSEAEFVGLAQGEVVVPADRGVALDLSYTRHGDLSCLRTFRPDDLFMLSIGCGERFPQGEPHVYEQVRRLSGLQILSVGGAGLTGQGLGALDGVDLLRGLSLSAGPWLRETELSDMPELPSVEWLDCCLGITDGGLKNLGRLRNLRVLRLWGDRIRGRGLADLARLAHLEHLCLWGEAGPTDAHVQSLETLTQLKRLTLWGGPGLTSRSLAVIGKLTGLEELTFIHVRGLTDEGMRHLEPLEHLRYVEFDGVLGDETIRVLSRLPRLEAIVHVHPGPEGMAILGRCRRLKTLDVLFRPGDSGGPATAGLEHLAGLQALQDLTLSGLQIHDAAVAHLESLPSLRHLTLLSQNVTNAALASICKLHGLESLKLYMVHITKKGLNQLNDLKNLRSLVVKTHPRLERGDDATLGLSGLTSLKKLSLLNCQFGLRDEDLAFLPALTELESLNLAVAKPQSVWGASLPGMSKLEQRGLAVLNKPVSSEVLRHVGGLKQLSYLRLPMMTFSNEDDFSSLRRLTNLGTVDLSGRIPEPVLYHLDGLPPSVAVLRIRTTEPVSGETMYHLRQSLPNLLTLDIQRIEPGGRPQSRPVRRRR
jgi:hypothetical protein